MCLQIGQELVNTEERYLNSMQLLYDVFQEPLSTATSAVVTHHVAINKLFETLLSIIQLQSGFYVDMKIRLDARATEEGKSATAEEQRELSFAKVFLKFTPYFKMYKSYIAHHTVLLDSMQELTNSKKWTKTVAQCEKKEQCQTTGAKLMSLLIAPIQRVPRYKLFLEQLVKYTDPSSPDFNDLQAALKGIQAVASDVNEAIHAREKRKEVLDIQRSFVGNVEFVTPSRIFIRKQEFRGSKESQRTLKEPQCLILFNDMLICATIDKSNKFVMRDRITLDQDFRLEDLPAITPTETEPYIVPDSFRICISGSGSSFIASCDSSADKKWWLTQLKVFTIKQSQHLLLRHCGAGDLSAFEELADNQDLVHNPELFNAVDDSGWTCIMYAASGGNVEILQLVVEAAALHEAKQRMRPEMREEVPPAEHSVLACKSKLIEVVNARQQTALMIACREGRVRCVEYLMHLSSEESLESKDVDGRTALQHASSSAYIQKVLADHIALRKEISPDRLPLPAFDRFSHLFAQLDLPGMPAEYSLPRLDDRPPSPGTAQTMLNAQQRSDSLPGVSAIRHTSRVPSVMGGNQGSEDDLRGIMNSALVRHRSLLLLFFLLSFFLPFSL